MNELNEKTRQLLSSGRHNSAIRAILEAVHTSKGIERERLKTQLQVLLRNDEMKLALDDEMRATLAGDDMLPGFELMPDKYHFTGKAAFPVFNESGCRIAMLNCEQIHENKIIDFRADSATKGAFATAINEICQYVQLKINAGETRGNDVTVLNWGLSFSFHYNPVVEGLFETSNDDILDGDSFHFAALAATLSLISKQPVDPGYIFTGTFEGPTNMKVISKLIEKTEIIQKERPAFKKIVIPERTHFKGSDRSYIESHPDIFLEVNGFDDFVLKIFDKKADELLKFDREVRHNLGIARIIAINLGVRELELYDRIEKERVNRKMVRFDVINCEVTKANPVIRYIVFPLPSIYAFSPRTSAQPKLFLINFPSANHYVGNLLSNNGQSRDAFAIGMGSPPTEAIIFAYRAAGESGIIGKTFKLAELS